MTNVYGIVLGVELDGDIHVIIRVHVWVKKFKFTNACIMAVKQFQHMTKIRSKVLKNIKNKDSQLTCQGIGS